MKQQEKYLTYNEFISKARRKMNQPIYYNGRLNTELKSEIYKGRKINFFNMYENNRKWIFARASPLHSIGNTKQEAFNNIKILMDNKYKFSRRR